MKLLRIYDPNNGKFIRNDVESERTVSLTFFRKGQTRSEEIVVSDHTSLDGLAKYIRKMTTPR